jgi:hypothetical protein
MRARSPHYSGFRPRGSRSPNLESENERSDAVIAALAALKTVAAADPDHARAANRVGFARSDVARGHRLAGLSSADVASSPDLAHEILKLAVRYRRQASFGQRWQMGLERQGDLFDC